VTLRERVKDALGNILLVAASITICYAVAEFVFFRFMLPYMSLNTLPQGMGDWLYANGGDQSKPHHSANVLGMTSSAPT
jgi:hypothetical protein